ncbi:MAG: YfiR family protein [candidate division Zixibacteria bacterium]|nr:YfiR family protein [candidate division Zixibacteria bacterium]
MSALLFPSGRNLPAKTEPHPEYALKAVFLFNFAQFVNWPADAFPDGQAPLVIGVLGEDPFGNYLEETVQGEKVDGRPLTVSRYSSVDEIDTCHVLFISQSEAERADKIISKLDGRSILTVTDARDFSQTGIMIRFVSEKKKIKLKINVDAAKAAELAISSKLLRLADIVRSDKE